MADRKRLTSCVYNLAGISMTPRMMAKEVEKFIPGATFSYVSDPLREGIAATWPNSVDDKESREDWGWNYNPTPYEFAK